MSSKIFAINAFSDGPLRQAPARRENPMPRYSIHVLHELVGAWRIRQK
jgi:hypothetical protein